MFAGAGADVTESCTVYSVCNINCAGVEERCPGEMFQCQLEGNCIPANWTCDGHPDCDDKSDENDCGNYIVKVGFYNTTLGQH